MHSTGRLSLVARLLAVGAVGASIITSAPMASAAITSNNPPDLTVSVTASPSPTVARSATHTYVLLVTNSSWSGRLRVPGQNLFGNVRVHLTYNFSDERRIEAAHEDDRVENDPEDDDGDRYADKLPTTAELRDQVRGAIGQC